MSHSFYSLGLCVALFSPLFVVADVISSDTSKKIPTEINWQACNLLENPNLLCAQYPVPLNYKNTKKNAKFIHIALIKLPANNPAKKRLGSLFLNPHTLSDENLMATKKSLQQPDQDSDSTKVRKAIIRSNLHRLN